MFRPNNNISKLLNRFTGILHKLHRTYAARRTHRYAVITTFNYDGTVGRWCASLAESFLLNPFAHVSFLVFPRKQYLEYSRARAPWQKRERERKWKRGQEKREEREIVEGLGLR